MRQATRQAIHRPSVPLRAFAALPLTPSFALTDIDRGRTNGVAPSFGPPLGRRGSKPRDLASLQYIIEPEDEAQLVEQVGKGEDGVETAAAEEDVGDVAGGVFQPRARMRSGPVIAVSRMSTA
ncbi:hypothetical protein ABID08_000774 [Rhizobium binae]|uniref:Uncharacterized protein n=1 Tax=Rhizobium binae TaxID=1138190 RepID=A0ABV2MAG4_9HYPH